MNGEKEADRPTTDACLVMDRDRRIVQWSDAVGELLNIDRDAAIGQECSSVVGGRDPSGDPVCRAGCPAIEAAQDGRTVYPSPMIAGHNGTEVSLTCNVVALPGQPGNVLITLAGEPVGPDEKSRLKNGSAAGILRDLAGVGSLVASTGTGTVGVVAERTLDWLRHTLDVEAAEVFLREPGSDDMLLSYVRGPFRSAFNQIVRFHAGEGFPGLVLSRGAAVRTADLPAEERYLRTRVKEEGFLSYTCVPLRGSDGIIGTLNIAARRSDLDLDRAQRVLEWASAPLTSALESASLKARLGAVPQPVANGTDGELEVLSRHLLQRMMSVGDAVAGELMVYTPSLQGTMYRVAAGGMEESPGSSMQTIAVPDCPVLGSGHGIALHGRRANWPSPCQHISMQNGVTHCLPIVADGDSVGLVRLQYEGNVPSPPTNHLALLLAIATQAAPTVRQARDAAWKNACSDGDGNGNRTSQSPQIADVKNGHRALSATAGRARQQEDSDGPFLNIRCFGSFELYREGRLLPPDAVQRRGALALLKILLVNDGRPVPRDILSEALWPGADPGVTANRLYVLIHALRRAIEPSSHRHKRRWTFICNDGDRYYISPDAPYRCDIRDFRRAVDLGERQARSGDLRSAIDSYNVALDLYTGDLFEDEPYAEWCWAERENFRETVLGVAMKIANQYDEWGAPDQSIVYYQRALRIDPLREQTHRRLIEALLTAGRRSEAQRQYSTCEELLRRELGVEPMPETKRLQQMTFADPQ